jgi:DNA-binding MarR family transcriptional regulator
MESDLLRQMIERYTLATFTINRSMNTMIRELMPDGMTTEQYLTLNYIHKRGSCTSTELADSFHVGRSTITAIISRLADKRLIERVPHEKDRRVICLFLSDEGKKITDAIDGRMAANLSSVLLQFDEPEARSFMLTYEKLADVLDHTGREGDPNS